MEAERKEVPEDKAGGGEDRKAFEVGAGTGDSGSGDSEASELASSVAFVASGSSVAGLLFAFVGSGFKNRIAEGSTETISPGAIRVLALVCFLPFSLTYP